MAKTRISSAFNQVVQADLLFWKSNIVLHMIDECTRYSMLAIVAGKTEYDLCSALKTWWFRIFSPPKLLLDQLRFGPHTHTHTHTPTPGRRPTSSGLDAWLVCVCVCVCVVVGGVYQLWFGRLACVCVCVCVCVCE